MDYIALATDYDGTLAHRGAVAPETIEALTRLRQSGRKLILVTGRELPDLKNVFPEIDFFNRVVAENGALLYSPVTGERRLLANPPQPEFAEELRRRGVQLSRGEAIVATVHPYETTVLEVIRDLHLELQVIFNKGSVMVLPSGVNKRTGLEAALADLHIASEHVVGVGDAENDHPFLECCGLSVAVANALPAVKETADFTTRAPHGQGVAELIDLMLADQLIAPVRR